MNISIKEKFKEVTPDYGMILTDGEIYTYYLCMPKDGDVSVWREISIEEYEREQESGEQDIVL